MNKYMVVGYFESSEITFSKCVECDTSNDAVIIAVKELADMAEKPIELCLGGSLSNESKAFVEDINIVSVFNGHLNVECDSESVSSAIDWPGMNEN